ncbi:MAG TPA: RNA polymerase sigma factor [Polyangiales bacterium]
MDSYRRYGPALLRKARRLLRNEDDALDAVQALFLDLIQREAPEQYELAWLYRALTHRCLNLLRDRKNRARILARESPALAFPSRIAPDAQALGLNALCKLSDRVEEVVVETLVYRFFDELGLEEIASVMNVSRKTVQNRLTRALEALQAITEEASP